MLRQLAELLLTMANEPEGWSADQSARRDLLYHGAISLGAKLPTRLTFYDDDETVTRRVLRRLARQVRAAVI